MFSKTPAINWLSAARMFLFGARDVWFVVGVPVFLHATLGWSFYSVGGFLAAWVIGYGFIQASAPVLVKKVTGGTPGGLTALILAGLLALVMAGLAFAMDSVGIENQSIVIIVGLGIFGLIFALNSAVHSYLIVAYSESGKVAMNVGFYYMANAMGRLLGTVLSGLLFQFYQLPGCLWASVAFAAGAALLSVKLLRDAMCTQ